MNSMAPDVSKIHAELNLLYRTLADACNLLLYDGGRQQPSSISSLPQKTAMEQEICSKLFSRMP